MIINPICPEDICLDTKSGWTEKETTLLFDTVEKNKNQNSLNWVFEYVSRKTGRKPNSIRNYYYNSKKQSENAPPPFETFSKQEIFDLMVYMLNNQAKGMSVRKCSMTLADGDKSKMLRYQNKYRSIIKSNKAYVEKIMVYLKKENMDCFDPYANCKGVGKEYMKNHKESDFVSSVSNIVSNLQIIDEVSVEGLIKGLETLTNYANIGKNKDEYSNNADINVLKTQNSDYIMEINNQNKHIAEQNKYITQLQNMLYSLIEVNREFLNLNSVIKISTMKSYLEKLNNSITKCERGIGML